MEGVPDLPQEDYPAWKDYFKNVLKKVELLVTRARPKVLAIDDCFVFLQGAFVVDELDRLASAEWRIGQDHRVFLAPGRSQRIKAGMHDHPVSANAVLV